MKVFVKLKNMYRLEDNIFENDVREWYQCIVFSWRWKNTGSLESRHHCHVKYAKTIDKDYRRSVNTEIAHKRIIACYNVPGMACQDCLRANEKKTSLLYHFLLKNWYLENIWNRVYYRLSRKKIYIRFDSRVRLFEKDD